MRFNIIFKKGMETVARVEGIRDVAKEDLTLSELEKAIQTEQLLEKLTGLRVHVEEVQ